MTDWRNRIVGHGTEKPDQLLANPANWRVHPKSQQEALEGVLDEVGWVQDVIVNQRTGHLVDGHLRVTLALRNHEAEIPVVYVDLDENEEGLVLASLDPIAAMAAADKQKLDELMQSVNSDNAAVQQMLSDIAETNGLDYGKKEPPEDPGAQVDKAEELRIKWGVETGQMWQLGEHRLICGDCTDLAVVERLLGEAKPGMMVTDPPYGVNYDPQWRVEAGIEERSYNSGKVENDDNADWTSAWKLFPGDVAYVWHAGVFTDLVKASLETCDLRVRAQIVWNKDLAVFGRGDYHWKHEPCWYAVRKGKSGNRTDDRTQSTVWDIPTIHSFANGHNAEEWQLTGHGTQKPIECMERPIRNHNFEMVYEPFCGSGTTLIACERLDRKCRAVEISPAYVAVALERWAQMTGKTPTLLQD